MLKLIKYSARQGLGMRLWTLAAVLVLNGVFISLGAAGVHIAAAIIGVVLSSLALAGVFVVVVIADVLMLRSLFSAPVAYPTLLVPEPGWKTLLSRIIPMAVFDILSLTIGIAGIVVQAIALDDRTISLLAVFKPDFEFDVLLTTGIYVIATYLLLILSICFVWVLIKSVFFRTKLKGLLAVASFFAAHYLLSLLLLPLLAVTPYDRFGFFFYIGISAGFNAGAICYLLLLLLQTFILFVVTARLIERRINL
jgi:hypothetical protein